MGPVPIAFARPLALAAGQVVGDAAGAFCAGVRPKEGLHLFGQENPVRVSTNPHDALNRRVDVTIQPPTPSASAPNR